MKIMSGVDFDQYRDGLLFTTQQYDFSVSGTTGQQFNSLPGIGQWQTRCNQDFNLFIAQKLEQGSQLVVEVTGTSPHPVLNTVGTNSAPTGKQPRCYPIKKYL